MPRNGTLFEWPTLFPQFFGKLEEFRNSVNPGGVADPRGAPAARGRTRIPARAPGGSQGGRGGAEFRNSINLVKFHYFR